MEYKMTKDSILKYQSEEKSKYTSLIKEIEAKRLLKVFIRDKGYFYIYAKDIDKVTLRMVLETYENEKVFVDSTKFFTDYMDNIDNCNQELVEKLVKHLVGDKLTENLSNTNTKLNEDITNLIQSKTNLSKVSNMPIF